jgi:hypothetical protein
MLLQELGEGPLLAQISCRQMVGIPVVEENDSMIFDEWRAELQGVFGGPVHIAAWLDGRPHAKTPSSRFAALAR